MPTPVEVTHIKRTAANPSGVEGLGGTWRDKPWYMSEPNLIWEIERPDSERQWDFFVVIDGERHDLAVDRGRLTVPGKPIGLFGLPEWQYVDERGWPVISP
jgi:hypothetical protein